MRRLIATATLAVLAACGSPCSTHRVVQATRASAPSVYPGVDTYDIELDDGHVYRGPLMVALPAGREVEVCDVKSKIDGSEHFSMHFGHSTPTVQQIR